MQINWVLDKGSRETNEDALLVKDDLFGVFDGGSSVVKYIDSKGKTGGFLAANITKRTFENGSGDLLSLAKQANLRINQKMRARKVDLTDKANRWCTALAVINLGRKSFDWVQIGDCLILIIFKDNWKKFVELFNQGGLGAIEAHVRQLEKSDPNCWQYPRYKTHDDLAAISITFGIKD